MAVMLSIVIFDRMTKALGETGIFIGFFVSHLGRRIDLRFIVRWIVEESPWQPFGSTSIL